MYVRTLLITFVLGVFMKAHAQVPTLPEDPKARVQAFFTKLSASTIEICDQFYAPNITFIDSAHSFNNLKELKDYYAKLYKDVESIKFHFHAHSVDGETHTLEWTMDLKAPGLNGGKEYSVDGVSVLRYDPKLKLFKYHRDYFDMGAFVYERIPLLKYLIKMIRSKLGS